MEERETKREFEREREREKCREQNAEKLAENGRREGYIRARVFIEFRSPNDVLNKETRLLNRETPRETFKAPNSLRWSVYSTLQPLATWTPRLSQARGMAERIDHFCS